MKICLRNLPYKQLKNKIHMINLLDARKDFDKIQHLCMIKVLERRNTMDTKHNKGNM